jgi:hypothetical protein
MTNLPEHSPVGGSVIDRIIACPGSRKLIEHARANPGMGIYAGEEPEYRQEGTCAHEAAAWALQDDFDAWEMVGMKFSGVELTAEMADAIQVYLDYARTRNMEIVGIEQEFYRPDLHPLYFGTEDLVLYDGTTLEIVDFKFGKGIVKEAYENPQLMYYALGLLDKFVTVDELILTIVQPRAWHKDGPIRSWSTTRQHIWDWGAMTCIPAIVRSETDTTLNPGEHCRFCEAKLECPALRKSLQVVQEAPTDLAKYDLATLVGLYENFSKARMLMKAVENAVYTALAHGKSDPRVKLVSTRTNRIWKEGAEDAAKEKFGDEIFTRPELKSPAEIDKLGPAAKAFTKEHAYSPYVGTTLALAEDKRAAVKSRDATETFREAIERNKDG